MDTIESPPSPVEPAAPVKRSKFKRLFVGDAGLRAGWGIAGYIVGLILISAVLIRVGRSIPAIHAIMHTDRLTALVQTISSGTLLIAAVLPLIVLKLVERRPFADYGIGSQEFAPRFALGAATGIAGLSALCLVLIAIGAFTTEGPRLTGSDVLTFGAGWFGANVVTGAAEEIVFRGVLFTLAARGLGWRWGAIVSSVAFGLAHAGNGSSEGVIGLIGAGAIGLVLCWSVHRSGTLAWAWGLHILWNWGESYLFGTPNSGQPSTDSLFASTAVGASWLSGGETGPEGSALVFLAIALMAFIGVRTLGRRTTT